MNSFTKTVARTAAVVTAVAGVQLIAPVSQADHGGYAGVAADTVANVTLRHNLAQFGQTNRATVRVSVPGDSSATPDGTVRLRIVGVRSMSKTLPADGTVSFSLPRRLRAEETYGIVARFSSSDTEHYEHSRDTAFLTVAKANTTTNADAGNIRRGQRPKVDISVVSDTGLNPRGRVRVKLIKNGDVRRTKAVRLRGGDATARFGKVGQRGKWTAEVIYRGNRNFEGDATTTTFRVTRR